MNSFAFEGKDLQVKNLPGQLVIGNRVPKDYFITMGTGESDITIHAGSYHLALKDAGIEMANIMTYSSILPGIANQVEKPQHITHGEVMESIMSVCNTTRGVRATAGITYGWLYDRLTGEKYGGLVCEHQGNYEIEEIKNLLGLSLNELYTNGFSERFELRDIEVLTNTFVPQKQYGTALVSLCFTSYVVPFIPQN